MNTWLRVGLVIAISVGLMSPTLSQGFIIDDPMILSIIEERYPERPHAFDVYSVLLHQWELFWWTKPDLELKFFRPLGSALVRLDHAVFGRWAPGWHLHSLLWMLLFLLAVALLYRRLDPLRGLWIVPIVAFDESFAVTAGWISNRHALVAMTFGVVALWAHIRWREDSWRPGPLLAAACYVLSLLAAETGLAVLAYAVAYEWMAGPGGPKRKALGLSLPVGIGLVYVAWYKVMGYGLHGGAGMYIDPGADPWLFMREASGRIPALLAGGILGAPPDLWIEPDKRPMLIAIGLVGTSILLGILRANWSSIPGEWRRHLRWLLPGALLSCLPLVATFPSHRQMVGPMLGIAPAVMLLLYLILQVYWPAGSWRRWAAASLGVVLLLVHGLLAPLMQIVIPRGLQSMREGVARNLEGITQWDPALGFDEVVALQSPDGMTMFYGPVLLDEKYGTRRGHWTVLSAAPFDHRWTRTSENALELELLNGEMLTTFPENHWPVLEGQVPGLQLAFRGVEIQILEMGQHGPKKVAFTLPRSLDDPHLLLLVWVEKRFERFVPPKVGESVVLPWTRGYGPFP